MDYLRKAADLILHLDKHLDTMVDKFGPWLYVILFLIIFAETGLVVTPILPGDSLLFAVGTIAAASDDFNLPLMIVLLIVAAILGDSVNYWIGNKYGTRLFKEHSRWLNRKHLDKTHEFYERYGGKTIILARFMPIIRTFAPFVAGLGSMTYGKFMSYNVIGGIVWIVSLTLAGYFFGNIPIVKNNFGLVIIMIIVLSVLPAVIEIAREWMKRKKA
ncbi:MAG TPA: DedA family protein [Methylomirabilota bacterium]|nr:DedA family protein [Methylomirabilota bacterium]